MTLAIQIIGAIIVFSLLVFIHEMGHFLAAKMFKVKVNEFAIGMGPKICSWGKGETKFSLRWIPLGGFCMMEGEDESSDDPRAFSNAKNWSKIVILAAGGIFNLVAGIILCITLMGFTAQIPQPVIKEFTENSAIEQAGGQIGDEILAVNGWRALTQDDVSFAVYRAKSNFVDVEVKRGNEIVNLNVEMTYNEEAGRYLIGFAASTIDNSFWNTLKYGSYEFVFVSKQIIVSLGDLVTGKLGFDQMSGPVGIVKEIGGAVGTVTSKGAAGLFNVAWLFLLITINLGIFNLIPFPALDGGRIFFVLVSMCIGKKINPNKEGMVHLVGFCCLILLVIVATGYDITRIFGKS